MRRSFFAGRLLRKRPTKRSVSIGFPLVVRLSISLGPVGSFRMCSYRSAATRSAAKTAWNASSIQHKRTTPSAGKKNLSPFGNQRVRYVQSSVDSTRPVPKGSEIGSNVQITPFGEGRKGQHFPKTFGGKPYLFLLFLCNTRRQSFFLGSLSGFAVPRR